METADNKLNLGGIPAETLADEFGTPLYVYEEAVIRERCRELRMAFSAIGPQIHYAIKANFNPAILAVVLNEGMGVDAVSPNEVRLALEVGFLPDQILFTGNNTSETEMREVVQLGVPVNVGSLGELDRFGRLNPGGRVSVRINPDVGDGHH
ncbi:MAG: diaminopimelate decarboxylase, partial [Deltaproteobacteria bacterium]|nr:diaminopimelate decarboxylase [Deltaproteobacteria bacterium]